jgi:hypothetical protein
MDDQVRKHPSEKLKERRITRKWKITLFKPSALHSDRQILDGEVQESRFFVIMSASKSTGCQADNPATRRGRNDTDNVTIKNLENVKATQQYQLSDKVTHGSLRKK